LAASIKDSNKNKKFPVSIDMKVTGAEVCIEKIKKVTEFAKELKQAIEELNDMSITITTTHTEKGEGQERQV
jgi:glutamine synthetase